MPVRRRPAVRPVRCCRVPPPVAFMRQAPLALGCVVSHLPGTATVQARKEQQVELREQAHRLEMTQQQLQAREREHALELRLAAAKHAAELARAEALVKVEAPVESAALPDVCPQQVSAQPQTAVRLATSRLGTSVQCLPRASSLAHSSSHLHLPQQCAASGLWQQGQPSKPLAARTTLRLPLQTPAAVCPACPAALSCAATAVKRPWHCLSPDPLNHILLLCCAGG